jgi:hypothetical protein
MDKDVVVDLIKQYGQDRAIEIALNAGVPVTAIQFALNTPIGQAATSDFYNMMGDVGSGMKTGALNLSDMLFGTNFITPQGIPTLQNFVPRERSEMGIQSITPQEQVQQTQQNIINQINQANQNNQSGSGSFVSGPAGMSGPPTPTGPNLVNRAQGGIVSLYGGF